MQKAFSFHATRNAYELRHGNQVIARGDANYGFGVLRDLVLHPGTNPLIALHQIAPTGFPHSASGPKPRKTENGISIMLRSTSADRALRNTCEISVALAPGHKSFTWDFKHELRVARTTSMPKRFFPRTDSDKKYADKGVWAFEFTDPMPIHPFAPKDGPVLIDRPDIIFPQPWFRKNGWKANWSHFVFTRNDGELIRVPMNHLENHDKDFWRQSPDGFVAFVGGKGVNLRYRFLDGTGKNVCHHYCMWGYDIHFWEIIAPGTGKAKNPVPRMKKGAVLKHHYVLEALADKESARLLKTSVDHPWRQGDRRTLDNTPGINRFQAGLGRQDSAGFFQPTSTCDFLPGHPGRKSPGCLRIDNHWPAHDICGKEIAPYNAWTIRLGSDNWHTPIESSSVYEITAWVKLQTEEGAFARIAMEYDTQFNQAKPNFYVKTSKPYFSNSVYGPKTGWSKLLLRTPKLPRQYVSMMRIRLELFGKGLAYCDEFGYRRVT